MSDALSKMRSRITRRLELIAYLGGECAHCGNHDPRVLEVDHVNGHGRAERRAGIARVHEARFIDIVRERPGEFQLLCGNCHRVKTRSDRLSALGFAEEPAPFTAEELAATRARIYSSEAQRARAAKRVYGRPT